jgi:hypothetical protein
VSAELELQLRNAIMAFGEAWVDEAGSHPFEILKPARPATLLEIEELLGAPLPVSVRIVLETLDGSYIPVSPERPDIVMPTSGISGYLGYSHARDFVPLVECELDPETGMQRMLGVAVADPWGPLRHDDGNVDTRSLLAWFEQVTAENATYTWPAPRQLTPSGAWASRAQLSEADMRDMPVGAAIAVHVPQAKRNRIRLQLFVQLEPGVWARGISRKRDGSPSLHEMCAEASDWIGRETCRARSQWVLGPAQIVPRLREPLFVGTVVID